LKMSLFIVWKRRVRRVPPIRVKRFHNKRKGALKSIIIPLQEKRYAMNGSERSLRVRWDVKKKQHWEILLNAPKQIFHSLDFLHLTFAANNSQNIFRNWIRSLILYLKVSNIVFLCDWNFDENTFFVLYIVIKHCKWSQ
jgi:hypothetical protein